MLAEGLINEVQRLREVGLEQNLSASRAIGYRETLAWLAADNASKSGGALAGLAAEICQNTRALVKKQRTWFRNQLPAHRELAADSATVADLF
jgi:tRNA dimethylallyltransferase